MKRLKHDKRGVSNVIVVMLSLVLIVVIVANVVLWSYQMNQFDWERMQENLEIVDIARVNSSSWFVAQSEYIVNTGNQISGSYTDTQTINNQYETFAEAPSGWLTGWDKRIKITIDHNDIDDTLNNFPVSIYLSNSSGRNKDDVSCVFDEIGNNMKKIGVTTSDGTTQCYVEIEKWDAANEKAWLWVRVPNISSSQDTVLYLYYDADHADNTTYVGEPNSTVAENVWDNDFRLVMHSHETSGSHYDSTSNDNNGVPQGGVTQDATGKIDGADDFDGTDDRIQVNDSSSLSFTNNELTMETWVKLDSLPTDETTIIRKDNQWQIGFIDSDTIRNLVKTDGITGWTVANDEDYSFQTDTWYYWTFVYNGSKIVHKINAEQVGSTHTVTESIVDNSAPIYIAYCVYTSEYFNGIIDEVRVSNTARSHAWIKASYESGKDDLVAYGSEEGLGVERNELDIVGVFVIDLSTYPLTCIQTVEMQLRYRASDTGEHWFLKAYNWTGTEYRNNGFNSTEGNTPTTGWDYYTVNFTDQWQSYVHNNGTVYVKLVDEGPDTNQTIIEIDFLAVRVAINGTKFTFQNGGSLTSHLVSLWANNATHHQRCNANIFINSGDTVYYIRGDINLPDKPYTIRVITERGNTAVFTSH